MEPRTRRLYEAALAAEDYRAFLSQTFAALAEGSRTKRFNYSSFARKAGLQSRGFAKEVVTGRKRLTSQSYPKFERALALPLPLKKYFSLLVMREEPDLNDRGLDRVEMDQRIDDARERIKDHLATGDSEGDLSEELYRNTHYLSVYSVLGDREKGASFEEVVRKTRLHPALCERVLEHLVKQSAAVEFNGRYRSVNPHLVFQGLKGDHSCRGAFLETIAQLKKRANDDFDHPEQLFIHSYFTVDRRRLPELRKRLWSLVLEFVDQCDSNDGDSVHKLVVGLFS